MVVNLLKPLDLQTIMPRTVDLQRMQQIASSRPITEQQDVSREIDKQSQLRQEQVQNNEASSNSNRIREEESDRRKKRERRYRHYNHDKKAHMEENELDKEDDTDRGRHIDIKI